MSDDRTIKPTIELLKGCKGCLFESDTDLSIFSNRRGVFSRILEDNIGMPISRDLPVDIDDMERIFGLFGDLVKQTSYDDVEQKLLNSGWHYTNLITNFSKAYYIMWIYKQFYITNQQPLNNLIQIISEADDNEEYQELLTIESVCEWSDWKIVTSKLSLWQHLMNILDIVRFNIRPLDELLEHKESVKKILVNLLNLPENKGTISQLALYYLVCFLIRTNDEPFFINHDFGYSGWSNVYNCRKLQRNSEETTSDANFKFDPFKDPSKEISIIYGPRDVLLILLCKLLSLQ